jgi:F-type H+/Na+-transporting ATPase subunit alpha
VLPAVDVGQSVSRVGGEAQRPAYRAVAGPLKLAYAQFEELESFARFGTRLDETTARAIDHGRRIRECLKQSESQPLSLLEQIVVLLALSTGLFDSVALARMVDAEAALREASTRLAPDLAGRLITDELGDDDRRAVLEIAAKTLTSFQSGPPSPDLPPPAKAAPAAPPPPGHQP